MSDSSLIEIKDLSRKYVDNMAVNHISFDLKRGEVLGFLGPNGAGKSTSMNMISGNLAPTTGSIKINQYDLLTQAKKAKMHLGYLPENVPVYPELTVNEYLRFCAKLHRIDNKQVNHVVDKAVSRCGLNQVRQRLIQNLSKGFQQRVGIAQAIIHSPAVIILDEPTVGLDPIQIREIRNLIRELGDEHAVILSTHILPEVQMICDRVQIIHNGNIVYSDSMQNLNNKTESKNLILSTEHKLQEQDLLSLPGVNKASLISELNEQRWRLQHTQENNPVDTIAKAVIDKGWTLLEIKPEQHSLEQIFVDIISCEGNEIGDNLDEVTK